MTIKHRDNHGQRGRRLGHAYCANMRRLRRPHQRPLGPYDALRKLMARVLESAAADADYLKTAADDLIEAKGRAKLEIDALHGATEAFIHRMGSMRRTLAWVEDRNPKSGVNSLQTTATICEVSPERFRQAVYDKLHKQTLDELLRRPGYICSACGHIHQ